MTDAPEKTKTSAPIALSLTWRGSGNAIAVPIFLIVVTAIGQYAFTARNVRTPTPDHPGDRIDQVLDRVDPNTAPWWELTILPGVGESTARAIVEHRRQAQIAGQSRPFKVAADLEHVHGIGPKTIERLEPLLRFDADSANTSAPDS